MAYQGDYPNEKKFNPKSINPELQELLKEWIENSPDLEEKIVINSITILGDRDMDLAIRMGTCERTVRYRYERIVGKFQNLYSIFQQHFMKKLEKNT